MNPPPGAGMRAMDYRARVRPAAAATTPASTEPTHHDGSLVVTALEEVEMKRANVETLLEAGVLGKCLSG